MTTVAFASPSRAPPSVPLASAPAGLLAAPVSGFSLSLLSGSVATTVAVYLFGSAPAGAQGALQGVQLAVDAGGNRMGWWQVAGGPIAVGTPLGVSLPPSPIEPLPQSLRGGTTCHPGPPRPAPVDAATLAQLQARYPGLPLTDPTTLAPIPPISDSVVVQAGLLWYVAQTDLGPAATLEASW